MLNKVSNRFLAVTILAIFVIALVGIISNRSLESANVDLTGQKPEVKSQQVSNTNTQKGYLQVLVVDSKTGNPVDGVNVVFSNLDNVYATGKDGKTPVVEMDITADPNSKMISQVYDEIVIGAFKEGFADYVLFNAKVKATTQDKPQLKVIRIVKSATANSTPVFAMEKYSSDTAKEMVDKLRAKLSASSADTQQIEEIDITE